MRIALVDELRSVVPFGPYVWAVTDPVTEVGISPLADVPWLMSELPRLIRARYLTSANRWSSLGSEARSLHRVTDGDLDQSRFAREVRSRVDLGDIASVCFRDRHGFWGWLELWRLVDEAPFSDADLDLLTAVAPVITTALRRAHATTFELPAVVPDRPGPVVLMLSAELDVIAQTPSTDEYLRALLPPDAERRPVPAGAYNVAAQLLAVEAGIDDRPASSRVRLRDGVWLTFRAARVEPDARSDADEEAGIAVSIEPTSPAERLDLFARASGLSPRETELLGLLADGADTRTVAGALFVSEHTVQDHLKSIFEKTGARNRRTLLVRVSGR